MNAKGHFRWVICALPFFACVVNYMDRQVLGLLSRIYRGRSTGRKRIMHAA